MTKGSPEVIAIAKQWRKKDKRLSWETCLKKARDPETNQEHLGF